MEDKHIKGIIGLETILNKINDDLARNHEYNLEHIILRFSSYLSKDLSIPRADLPDIIISEISEHLLQISPTYCKIYNNPEKFLIFSRFIKFLLLKYDRMMITEKDAFDVNVRTASGQDPSKKELKSLGIDVENINDVQYTISLLNEAIRIYFELYDKRTLIALFSNNDIMKFRLEEATLAHVLGVNVKQIVSSNTLCDLFKITQREKEAVLNDEPGSAKMDVLMKVVDISSGNLLTYEEDRLRRVKLDRLQKFLSNPEYDVNNYDNLEKPQVFKYGKINMRSKAFINFKPLDEITLSIKFPKGYKLIRSSKDNVNHSILISKNSLSDIFKYSTFITDYEEPKDRRYFKSLEAKTIKDVATWKNDGEIAIATKVISEPDSGTLGGNSGTAGSIGSGSSGGSGGPGGSGGTYVTVFSEEKQKQFIREFLYEFYNMDNFKNLEEIQEYLDDLNKKSKKR